MYDVKTVKQLLEAAIDSLINNFISEPYLHRVEHSIHCELYSMLSVHRSLQGIYSIGDSSWKTGLIHKEWPEKTRRPERTKRGNFDLAILNPNNILQSTIETFSSGKIDPDFVIEMGLNYRLNHLVDDKDKFSNSGLAHNGYLVHLWQPCRGITSNDLAELIRWSSNTKANLAAAVYDGNRIYRKHLADSKLTELHKP